MTDDLPIRVPTLLCRLVAVLVAVVSCTPALPPVAPHLDREACYAQAEARVTQRALQECPGKWSTCGARPAILSEGAAAERACP